MSEALAILWNGEPVSAIPALSRGLHYGDGVFRTLLQQRGTVIAADMQLAKLLADAMAIGIAPPPIGQLQSDLAAASRFGDATVKLLLLRAGERRGYRPQTDAADRLLVVHPPPASAGGRAIDGIRAIRSPVTLAAQPLLAGIKHLNRLEQVLASRSWPDGVDEALLGDDRGHPVCATRANLFWVRDGVLHTPALDRCGVAGVTRARVLALAAAAGIDCRIGGQPWSALLAADEAFLSGSLIGIWPLRAIDGHCYEAQRPVTRHLQGLLAHPSDLVPSNTR